MSSLVWRAGEWCRERTTVERVCEAEAVKATRYATRFAELGIDEPADLAEEQEEVWTRDIKMMHLRKIKRGIEALRKGDTDTSQQLTIESTLRPSESIDDALCTEVHGFIDRARSHSRMHGRQMAKFEPVLAGLSSTSRRRAASGGEATARFSGALWMGVPWP